jgi:hypothetical protein
MFAPHCPSCDRRVLLGTDRVEGIRRNGRGHQVTLRCRCGTVVRWTGAAPASPAVTSL